MHLVNKTLALVLSFSLIGQSALWAAPSNGTRQPQNLAEYQQRAKQDIKRSPWVGKEGKEILNLTGTAAGLIVAQQAVSEKEMQAEINALKEQLAATQEELRVTKQKAEGWKKSSQTQRAKREAEAAAAKKREADLLAEYAALEERFNRKKSHYMDLAGYSEKFDYLIKKYEALFNKNTSEAQVKTLLEQLAKEPIVLQLPSEQQKQFLYIIGKFSTCRRTASKEVADGYMRTMIRGVLRTDAPIYDVLVAFCRGIYHAKLPIVLLLVTLGLSAHSANAQNMADRVNTNFDLFLNATPQELAEMEKDEQLRNVCIQGAEALHLMSNMTKEEAAALRQAFPSKKNVPNRANIDLAR